MLENVSKGAHFSLRTNNFCQVLMRVQALICNETEGSCREKKKPRIHSSQCLPKLPPWLAPLEKVMNFMWSPDFSNELCSLINYLSLQQYIVVSYFKVALGWIKAYYLQAIEFKWCGWIAVKTSTGKVQLTKILYWMRSSYLQNVTRKLRS